ncbi:DUF4252 domain-containing protein [uncultured Duncaniella sp.]|uniref:DUF4252 domain-containing protein n=1 Tax=uncultured Duncaniella sp. TaxID=2768039 RepID=UPI00260D1F7A|nr:DUF4252 domain-containing protein [uncultured Duncaniella sp.]
MKRLLTLLLLVVAIATGANAQLNKIYEKCQKEGNLTTVFVSKAMLQMAGNMGPMDAGNLAQMKDKIDNVLIVTADNSKGINFLTKLRKEFTQKTGYSSLMEINDDKSNVVIFQKKLPDNKNEFVLSIIQKSRPTMIVIDGDITLEDVAKMAGQNGKIPTGK